MKHIFSRHFIILCFLSILSTFAIKAQVPEFQLLTCYPGADFFQLEGHTGLRMIDPSTGDVVVNWGVFDFNTPNFAYRFATGETDYMAAACPTDYFLATYKAENRCVVAQTLNLTDSQAVKLRDLITENLLPENRVYRYNYVKDNCATRPLALIEKAVGDSLKLGIPAYDGHTFREAMRHYHEKYPWYQFGIDLALGSGIDKPITRREMSFSPMDLQSLISTATFPEGSHVVTTTTTLTGNPEFDATYSATPWYLGPNFICFFFLFLTALVTYRDYRRRKLTRWWDCLMYLIFALAGCLICFLIFVSSHEATSPNWLILWLNPLCFISAIGVWVKKAQKLVFRYQILNFALILALCIVLIAGVQSINFALGCLMAADALRSLTFIWLYRCRHTNPS